MARSKTFDFNLLNINIILKTVKIYTVSADSELSETFLGSDNNEDLENKMKTWGDIRLIKTAIYEELDEEEWK